MPRIGWMTAGFDRFVAQDTPVDRYAAMIFYRLSAPYVVATLTIYIIDGLTQWPKRWSFLTPNCWALGAGVLGMRAMMAMLERPADDELRSGEAGAGDPQDTVTDRAQQAALYDLGLRHCFTVLAAIIVVCATSNLIDIDGGSAGHQSGWSWNAVTAFYMTAVTICWAAPWVDRLAREGEKTTYTEVGSPSPAEQGILQNQKTASWWRILLVIAAVPLLLGTMKHVMSGTTLGAVYDRMDVGVSIWPGGSMLPHLNFVSRYVADIRSRPRHL
jgi:hypothetical protein